MAACINAWSLLYKKIYNFKDLAIKLETFDVMLSLWLWHNHIFVRMGWYLLTLDMVDDLGTVYLFQFLRKKKNIYSSLTIFFWV